MKKEIKEQLDMVCDLLDNAYQSLVCIKDDIDEDDDETYDALDNIECDIIEVQDNIRDLIRGE